MSQSNITFKEFIHDQGENYEKWVMRTILETYALALDIPLRLYDLTVMEQFWENANFLPKFVHHFPDKETFDNYVQEILTLPIEKSIREKILPLSDIYNLRTELREKYGDHFYLYHTGTNPMLHMLNEHWWWRWLDFSWYYHEFVLPSEKLDKDKILLKNWEFGEQPVKNMHLGYVKLPETIKINSILVAGPVWHPLPNSTGQQFEKDIITPFVEIFFETAKIVEKKIKESSHYTQDRLIRVGNSRPPIGELSLEDRLNQAKNALQSLFDLRIFDPRPLYRYDYVRLAEWSLFAARAVGMIQGFGGGSDGMVIYRHLARADELNTDEKPIWVKTSFTKEPLPQFSLSNSDPPDKASVQGTDTPICVAPNSTPEEKRLLDEFNKNFSRFIGGMVIKRNASKHEFTLLLQEQLDDRFGILASENDGSKFIEKLEELAKKTLCPRILRVLQADLVILYRYDYSAETLNTLGLYTNSDQKKQWEKEAKEESGFMRKAGKDPDKRKKSICYCCIDQQTIQFRRTYPPDQPNQPELLEPPSPLTTHHSGIAVPLSVHDRPWGVLEVLGNYPHQFRWSDRRFIEELGNILSPFFYHQWFLVKLHELNQFATKNIAEENPENYHNICHCLAEIFLSYGADLWFFKDDGFVCKGWHNWPGKPEILEQEVIRLDNKGLINFTLNQWKEHQQSYWQGTPSDFKLDQEWKDMPRNQPLINLKIEHFCCIPCAQSRDDPHPAFILLYNKVLTSYDSRWQSLITFVARYIALLFQAMRTQQDIERRNREFIAHELRTQAINIEERIQSVDTLLRKHVLHLLAHDLNRRFYLLIEDLKIFTLDFKNTVTLMKQENPGKMITSVGNEVIDLAIKQSQQSSEEINLLQQFNHVFRAQWTMEKRKNLSLNETIDPNIYLRAHGKNLREILSNLCENAIKYAHENTSIEAKTVQSKYGIKLAVSNFGECLDEGEEYRLFENGFRGYNTRGKKPGEGKGLYIVRGICELYSIGIGYNSQPGPNNHDCKHTFTLSFPTKIIIVKKRGHYETYHFMG